MHLHDNKVPPGKRSLQRRLKKFTPLALLGPTMFFIILVYTGSLISLFVFSFYRYKPTGENIMEKAFIFDNYIRFLSDPYYLNILWTTMKLSLIVTGITLVVGYAISYTMVRSESRSYKRLILVVVLISFLVAVLARIYSWMIILGQQGLLNNFLVAVGIISDANRIQFLGKPYGVIIGLSHILLPFMIFSVAGVLKRIDRSAEEAAQSLGANKIQTFLRVTLPLSMPAITSGCLLVYTLGISAFAVPLLLGGPSDRMISNYIYDAFLYVGNFPFGSAMAFILLFLSLFIILGYFKILQSKKLGGKLDAS
jgi:putative spermidine/putrescine transport system permease protein